MGTRVKNPLTLALLSCAFLFGCAQTKSNAADHDYYLCVITAAIAEARTNSAASPAGVDGPGGSCEAERRAFAAQLKAQYPGYTDEQVNDIIAGARNAVWRRTTSSFANE